MRAELAGLIFTGFGVLVLLAIAVRSERRASLVEPRQQTDEHRITMLEEKLYYLQDEDIRKGRMISQLQEELAAARERIRFLEGQQNVKPVMAIIEEQPLMVVIGDDPALLVDLAALRGVQGLEVTTLTPATYKALKRFTDTKRMQGKVVERVHFAVHATAEGITLDRTVTSVELSELLDGVRIAVFMGCVTAEIADLLPIIPSVVAFRDPVRHDEAWKFSLLFWRSISEGANIEDAFKRAKDRSPTKIRECAELIQM